MSVYVDGCDLSLVKEKGKIIFLISNHMIYKNTKSDCMGE